MYSAALWRQLSEKSAEWLSQKKSFKTKILIGPERCCFGCFKKGFIGRSSVGKIKCWENYDLWALALLKVSN